MWSFGDQLNNGKDLRWCDGPKCVEQTRVHIACIHDNGELRIYFDGKRVGTNRGVINPLTKDKRFGGFLIGSGFVGMIDEVRVSRVARYREDFVPQTRFNIDEETTALYHFVEGSGDVLKDISGNGHDDKIIGATWVNQASGAASAP